jgi:hypothetical protein
MTLFLGKVVRLPIMRSALVLGWIAVGLATAISSLWAFWGVYESFHEGWYFTSLAQNLILTSSQSTNGQAYSLDFNGGIYTRNKESNLGSQGFRAVRRLQAFDASPFREPASLARFARAAVEGGSRR